MNSLSSSAPLGRWWFLAMLSLSVGSSGRVAAQETCLSSPEFASVVTSEEAPCCQQAVCGIPCPAEEEDPAQVFAIVVGISVIISFVIGLLTYFVVAGSSKNYFVAGKSLPMWIVATTLAAQSVESNVVLGNADLSYKVHFWDGAVIPIGLGLSLWLNGIFFAAKMNSEPNVLTLCDVFAKRYGPLVEVFISLCTITSFLMILAGNLVGLGAITSYVWGITEANGIWLAAFIVWMYTVSGGLFSVAYTDVAQGLMGWTGCLVAAFYLIHKHDGSAGGAAPPSKGFPGYMYPNQEVCDMYQGVPCENDASACCYNQSLWCDVNGNNCDRDNGAFPLGDKRVFGNQMFDPYSLAPFPNAIFFNWVTIFVLAFGNLGALDFQVRCMAAKTPSGARMGCFIAGAFTFFIGIPFAMTGAITRIYYGPDSQFATFEADTCSEALGLPSCAAWSPDPLGFVKLVTHQVPEWIGAWCLIGMVAASMSTADGAILAMGTVFSHNVMRQLDAYWPNLVTSKNLLLMARLSTIPFAIIATLIGAYYKSNKAAGATGYLLIVAFDVVFATVVAPLFGAFYTKKPSPRAALCSVTVGAITRIILEFALPKDGFLLLPYGGPEFDNYGLAPTLKVPQFVDAPEADQWSPEDIPIEGCNQEKFKDYTGVDSLCSFGISVFVFVAVQYLEHSNSGQPLFSLPNDLLKPYSKDLGAEADVNGEKDKPLDPTGEAEKSDEDEVVQQVPAPLGGQTEEDYDA